MFNNGKHEWYDPISGTQKTDEEYEALVYMNRIFDEEEKRKKFKENKNDK